MVQPAIVPRYGFGGPSMSYSCGTVWVSLVIRQIQSRRSDFYDRRDREQNRRTRETVVAFEFKGDRHP